MTTTQPTTLKRSATLNTNAIDLEARTVSLSFSSETPYARHFGDEILNHQKENVRMERISSGGALLLDHDWSKQIGVVERAWLEEGKGLAVVRFGRSALASEVFNDVVDGIRRHISVGYTVHNMEPTENKSAFNVNDWEPLEISIVSVPADTTVGVGKKNSLAIHTSSPSPTKRASIMNEPQQNTVTNNTATQTRNHADEILTLADKFDQQALARQCISQGNSVEQFKAQLIETLHQKTTTPLKDNSEPSIGLSQREADSFSFQRALEYLINPTSAQAKERAGFELEVSRAAQDLGMGSSGGLCVPYDVLARTHTMGGIDGDTSKTAETIKQNYLDGSFIDILNNRSIALQLGTQMSGLQGMVKIPRQIKGSQSFWVEEKQAVEESAIELDFIEMKPHTSGVATSLTQELLHNSASNIESILRRDMATQAALAIDKAALYGTGKGQPLGLRNVKGLANHQYSGAMTFADFVEMEKIIMAHNADAPNMVFLMNPADLSQTKITPRGNGIQAPILEPGDRLNGFSALASNQIPTGEIFFGNFSDLLIGTWGGIELTVDTITLAKQRVIQFFMHQTVDFAVRHTESFCIANQKKKG